MNSEDLEILKWILGQAYRSERRKTRLDNRLKRLREEIEGPPGGRGYSPLPRAPQRNTNGAAGVMAEISDIEERIYLQKADIGKAIVKTMDILDYLPKNSDERDICEMRHIDMMQWRQIQEEAHMSRSQCFKIYRDALERILQNERIRNIVNENREEFRKIMAEKSGEKRGHEKSGPKKSGKKIPEKFSGKIPGENKREHESE